MLYALEDFLKNLTIVKDHFIIQISNNLQFKKNQAYEKEM